MNNKRINPEKYGIVICPYCNSHGYIQTPKRRSCPKCGGFGFIWPKHLLGVTTNEPRQNRLGEGGWGMGLIRKRRIWWESVPEATGYVVYVSKDSTTFDPSQFSWEATQGIISKAVEGRTELIIPDEWPEFPAQPGTYYIGITSRDDTGNQSDPFVSSGPFKFIPPPSPRRGGIESI